ncbi:MAG: carboxypeptidase-like regulatory domain-containing protein [Anaerolineae bacterium]|nr:carboxypeptidase-like regulatory domain-containing protein [Anaerolineae bacterium]NUQ04579.1 carboxypeptidase regulatory-like domain-containing protein [Anaerolineae bacterium]
MAKFLRTIRPVHRSLVLLAALLVPLSAITALHAARAQTAEILTGQAADALTSAPLAGVAITLTGADGGLHTTFTEADGSYRVEAIPSGTYVLTAALRGYTSPEPVDLILAGAATHRMDVTLTGMTTIAGRVFDGDGVTPLVGIPLLARGTDSANVYAAVTDADGSYSFVEMKPDLYIVEPLSVDRVFAARDAGAISRGQPLTRFDFAAVVPNTIQGRATGSDGTTPVAHVAVMVTAPDGGVFAGITAADGRYTVSGVTGTGTFTAAAYAETLIFDEVVVNIDQPGTLIDGVDFLGAPDPLALPEDAFSGDASIQITIIETPNAVPLAGVSVQIAALIDDETLVALFLGQPTLTDADGMALFDGLAAGRYAITAERTDRMDALLASADAETPQYADEAALDAALNRAIQEVVITLEAAQHETVEIAFAP